MHGILTSYKPTVDAVNTTYSNLKKACDDQNESLTQDIEVKFTTLNTDWDIASRGAGWTSASPSSPKKEEERLQGKKFLLKYFSQRSLIMTGLPYVYF